MKIELQPGKYVVAVSGGVDSVVLLDVLTKLSDVALIVAHFDHGIRAQSKDDAAFVMQLAARYKLTYITERVELGSEASEEAARSARYNFLEHISYQYGNAPIVLAHHQDDVLETAIHNLMRGTGRRGLTSLQSNEHLIRPLLACPKQSLVDYALQQNLSWREDTTNHDERYTRNYIRHRLLVRFDADARQRLLALISQMTIINKELDQSLHELTASQSADEIQRRWFCNLPHSVAKEVLMAWLRQRGLRDFDRTAIERLTVQLKTLAVGKRADVMHGYAFVIGTQSYKLVKSAKSPINRWYNKQIWIQNPAARIPKT